MKGSMHSGSLRGLAEGKGKTNTFSQVSIKIIECKHLMKAILPDMF